MKTFTTLCLAIALCMVALIVRAQFPCPVYNENKPPIAEGQEFLLCFMANEQPGYVDDQYQDIYIASLTKPANVRVTCPFLRIDSTFQLGILDTVTYHVSRHIARPEGALIYSTEVVDSSCIYVSADAPIICYGMNHKLYTADAFLALPRHTADMHHMVMSYPNSAFTQSFSERPSEFVVASWEDSNSVTIVPTALTSGGGGTLKFLLNKFESVQIQTEPFGALRDLTGTTITSDKPVAVFGGHMRAEVPVGYQQPGLNSTSRDHLAEQIPPTTKWGKRFVASNFFRATSNADEDLLRVLARDADTRVMINGVQEAILGAGQYYDKLIVGPVLVETSNIALVGMYAHTTATDKGTGDPFLAIIPPVEQFFNSFTFFVSDDPVYTDQHVLIFTERTGGVNGIFLDDTLLPALAFKPISGSLAGQQFSVADLILEGGIHRLRTNNLPDKGIAIVAYGWGEVDSYGYTAGALLKPTNAIIPGDDPKVGLPRGARPEPKVYLRNVFTNRIYFDKATIELDDPFKSYDVRLDKNIALDIRYIEPGVNTGLDLVVYPPNTETIRGTMKVEYHSSRYRNLLPVTVPFEIEPQESSGVREESLEPFAVSVHPNPVTNRFGATVTVDVEKVGPVVVRLLDATGREVFRAAKAKASVGVENLSVDTRTLPAGVYTCEIELAAQGATVRRQLVIMK